MESTTTQTGTDNLDAILRQSVVSPCILQPLNSSDRYFKLQVACTMELLYCS